MDNQVPEAVKKTRVALLNEQGSLGLQTFAANLVGKPAEILIEREEDGWYEGFTNEYIHGRIKKGDAEYQIGDIVGGTVVSVDGEFVTIA